MSLSYQVMFCLVQTSIKYIKMQLWFYYISVMQLCDSYLIKFEHHLAVGLLIIYSEIIWAQVVFEHLFRVDYIYLRDYNGFHTINYSEILNYTIVFCILVGNFPIFKTRKYYNVKNVVRLHQVSDMFIETSVLFFKRYSMQFHFCFKSKIKLLLKLVENQKY